MDADLLLALQLQEEWDVHAARRRRAQEPLSLVDPSWELVDPTPDVRALFIQFNDRFFWGQLGAVEVKWSGRMTLCAGVCSYEGNGGICSIRLSEPLLKLRPRKDLVETLLHEMIHAYLFITNNDKDREGHGPEFCKHMHRINRLGGTNITVYHTFYDEVDEYRRHWWRCNGPCRYRKPYYGFVKRAVNRAPSAHDYWWAEHQSTCGGTYIKIKEPESYSNKGKGKLKIEEHVVSATNCKDKPSRGKSQLLIPFTGKGYNLGEESSSVSLRKFITSNTASKTQNLLNQDSSASAPRQNSRTEVKFEQNSLSKNTSLISTVVNHSHQNVLSSYFPRISVANQKAFRCVNGSPTKSVALGSISKNAVSSDSQKRASSSKTPLRTSLKTMASTPLSASQDISGSNDKVPSKRPRLEDKTAFDRFFIKEEQKQRSNDSKDNSHPTTSAQNSSSSSAQNKMVHCPVCQKEVLESQIHEHLDCCLEGGGFITIN